MSALTTKAKLLVTVSALGATAAVAGLGTFGTFTDTTTASTPVDSGIVAIELGDVALTDALSVAATDIVPGDTIQRVFTLDSLTSTDNLASITLTTTAPTSSVLDTDATNGLQMTLQRCTVAWVESIVTPNTYTCGGVTSSVLAERAVIGSDLALSNLTSTTAGNTDQLKLTLRFPTLAGNSFQDKASTIQFAFTGTQRVATNK